MANQSDLRNVDLNLLVALDALLAERSVTLAARRLGIGPSAMSAALSRLRRLLDDELMTRSADGMRLTPRATSLAEPLRSVLRDVRLLVVPPRQFDPAVADRTFTIALPDGVELRLIPPLLARLRQDAPGVRLVTRSFESSTFASDLDADRLDLAIGFGVMGLTHHRLRLLFRSDYVVVYNDKLLRVGTPISLDDYVRLPHVVTSYGTNAVGAVDEALAAVGKRRVIVMRTSRFLVLPEVVRSSPVLATLARNFAAHFVKPYGLIVSPTPIKVPSFSINMMWHASYTKDPGHAWLRQAFVKTASNLSSV